MELNNGYVQKPDYEDRLSMLTDDILLSILKRVDITTATRTSSLSTRWKHLPWLLRELTIDVGGFLSVPPSNPIEVGHMDEAMASVTKAAISFLATPRSESAITGLQLKLYLFNTYSDVIGPLVSQAIDIGTLEDLDLAIVDEKEPDDCSEEEMRQQARTVDGFFSAYPSVLHCLSKLELYNVCFAEWDLLHHLLFDCCKQLQHLSLHNCDAGPLMAWKIQAPDSKLSFLDLDFCYLGKLEVLCLPKLEKLRWDTWFFPLAPLSFGVAPFLKELSLLCPATVDHQGFKLSKVLRDISIHTLTLNFEGEKLWIKPEGKQLCAAFKELRKLSLHGIFVEFDLLWMITLLEAAPSVEIFDIEIGEHPCVVDTEGRRKIFGERTNPSWNVVAEFKSCEEWQLKEVQVTGFSPMEQQLALLRAVMQRASSLQTIVLNDYKPCQHCDEIGALPRCERLPPERVFPKGKGQQDAAVEQLIGDMPDCSVQIIFRN